VRENKISPPRPGTTGGEALRVERREDAVGLYR
jgi:hypothetical protein